MDDVMNYLGRFIYTLLWAIALYCVVYLTSAVVREAKRTKQPLNYGPSVGVILGGAFLTAFLFMIVTGMSKLITDSSAVTFSKGAAILIVLLSMFVNCNPKLLNDVVNK